MSLELGSEEAKSKTDGSRWVIRFDHPQIRLWISANEIPDCYDVTDDASRAKTFLNRPDARHEILHLGLNSNWRAARLSEAE